MIVAVALCMERIYIGYCLLSNPFHLFMNKICLKWKYTSFFVGAVLPIFVSIPCLFHYFCCLSESCLGCLLYISCLFLAFYSLFSCSMQSQLNWIVISMYIGIANMLYIFQIKSIKTKKQKKNKKKTNDTFNRFHSPVIVHRKHEGAVTRHAFLPSSARKHLQLQGGLPPPTPPAYRFFFSGQWMLVFIWYIWNVYGSTTNLWSLYHSPDTCEADKSTCIAYGNVKHKKLFHRITNNK